jgi:hypothetical protein
LGKIDYVAPLQRRTQLRILETTAQDCGNYFVGVIHFEASVERTLIHNAVAKDTCDGVSHTIDAGPWVVNLW